MGQGAHGGMRRVRAAPPRAYDAEPADGLAGRKAVVLHHVEPNEDPCPPQARLAVHSDRAREALRDGQEPAVVG
jgi:hypothetical protein